MMKTMTSNARFIRPAVAAVLALTMAGTARAATLWAGPLNPNPAFLDCLAANVSNKPLDITIEVFSVTGAIIGAPSTFPNVPPRATVNVGFLNSPSSPRLCKFTFKGGKKKVRATACVSSDDRCDGSAVSAD